MYLDIVIGISIGTLVSLTTGTVQPELVLFGIMATLLPDLDFIIWLARNQWQINQFAHEHRDIFHHPLIVGLGGGLLIGYWYPVYGVIWFLGMMAHFIHDTFEGGWGIQWLYPFFAGYFTCVSYCPKHFIRNRAEQRALAIAHGTPHWTDWNHGTIWSRFKFSLELVVLGFVLAISIYWFLIR